MSLEGPWLQAFVLSLVFLVLATAGLRTARSPTRKSVFLIGNLGLILSLWFFVNPPVSPIIGGVPRLATTDAGNLDGLSEHDFVINPDGSSPAGVKARAVTGVEMLKFLEPEIKRLRVEGPGLSRDQLDAAGALELAFDVPNPADGFLFLDWDRSITLGETLNIQGLVSAPKSATVSLHDPFDNLLMAEQVNDTNHFRYQVTPKAAGRYIYQLVLKQGQQVLTTERIPVEITLPKPTSVHFKGAAPNFESSFLKRWARQVNVPIYFDIEISKDKFRRQWSISSPGGDENQPGLWIVELRRWQSMASGETALVLNQVQAGNAGLLFLGDSIETQVSLGEDLVLLPNKEQRTVEVEMESNRVVLQTGSVQASGQWLEIPELPDALRSFAGVTDFGAGNIGFTLVTDSYRLASAGHPEAHGYYWKTLIDQLMVQRASEQLVTSEPMVVSHRSDICLRSNDSQVTIVSPSKAQHELPLNPNFKNQLTKCALFWPNESGWHDIQTSNGTLSTFVFDAKDFVAWRQWRRTIDTAVASSNPISTTNIRSNPSEGSRLIPFLLFLGFAFWVWLEQKNWRAKKQLM